MNPPYYIVSDNHFFMKNTSEENDRRKKLFKVFEKIREKNEGTLIIGGDFFDYWFEYDDVIPKGYESIFQEFKLLKKSNIKLHYILGNHDYWDFGYLKKNFDINVHKNDLTLNLNNNKILLTHGDGLLKNDYGYRLLKKIIRSKIFIKIYKLFPASFTTKFANKLSKSSSHYNHNDKYVDIIQKDMLEYAIKKWDEGYKAVLIGHYHQTGIIDKKDKSLVFLGDWLSKYTVTMIKDNKIWQGNWKEFIDLS